MKKPGGDMRGLGEAELPAKAASRREFLSRASGTVVGGLLTGLAIRPEAAAAAFEQSPAGGATRRVIIDTDPGVDDALAIFLALRSPELKVEALTPVAGNVPLELTLPNALRLVE